MKQELIIDPDLLRQYLADSKVSVIDVRSRESYLNGHLPTAVHFDLSLLNRSDPPVNGLLPDIGEFNVAMGRLGLGIHKQVVVYDDMATPAAGRFVWTLLACGQQKVAMLDGGFQTWQQRDNPVTTTLPEVQTTQYEADIQIPRIADADYIRQRINDKAVCIIDTRSPAEFRGEDIRAARGGHIPGAINLNWELSKSVDNPALFKSETELKELLQTKGITQDKELICYCQSHQRSALLCVVLENLGYKNVKGYPGAWSDWGNRDDLPVER